MRTGRTLKTLCRRLQAFCESDPQGAGDQYAAAPWQGRTAVLLPVQWLFRRDPSEQIMTRSYNETLSTTFARAVRDGIAEEQFGPTASCFRTSSRRPPHQIAARLPQAEVGARGSTRVHKLPLPGSTATGFRSRKLILDDLIKGRGGF